jgi:hypothetical protein
MGKRCEFAADVGLSRCRKEKINMSGDLFEEYPCSTLLEKGPPVNVTLLANREGIDLPLEITRTAWRDFVELSYFWLDGLHEPRPEGDVGAAYRLLALLSTLRGCLPSLLKYGSSFEFRMDVPLCGSQFTLGMLKAQLSHDERGRSRVTVKILEEE